MVPVIREWKENPLATLIKRLPKNAQNELAATQRRVFASMMVVRIYTDPFHYYEEQDHIGQWADDGGKVD